MSTVSVNSSNREARTAADLVQEIQSIQALNSSLRTYLDTLKTFRKNLTDVDSNYKLLNRVNKQWVDTLNMMK